MHVSTKRLAVLIGTGTLATAGLVTGIAGAASPGSTSGSTGSTAQPSTPAPPGPAGVSGQPGYGPPPGSRSGTPPKGAPGSGHPCPNVHGGATGNTGASGSSG
jgi:hypothetical protein